jgi:hypothetical protein
MFKVILSERRLKMEDRLDLSVFGFRRDNHTPLEARNQSKRRLSARNHFQMASN